MDPQQLGYVTGRIMAGDTVPVIEAGFHQRWGYGPSADWSAVYTAALQAIQAAQAFLTAPVTDTLGSLCQGTVVPGQITVRATVECYHPQTGETTWRTFTEDFAPTTLIGDVYASLLSTAAQFCTDSDGYIADLEILPPLC